MAISGLTPWQIKFKSTSAPKSHRDSCLVSLLFLFQDAASSLIMRLSLRGGSKTRSLSLLSCSLRQYEAFYHGGETVYVRDSWLNHGADWISKDRQRGCSHLTDDYLRSSQ